MDESDGLENRCGPSGIFSEYRHETLTKQLPACYNSGAFSETTEGALFLPGAKDERSPPRLRGLFLFLVQFVCQNAVPNSSAGPQGGI